MTSRHIDPGIARAHDQDLAARNGIAIRPALIRLLINLLIDAEAECTRRRLLGE